MNGETAEKNGRNFTYFLRLITIIGIVFIGYIFYLFSYEGFQKRYLLMFQIALVITGIGFIMIEPVKVMFLSYKEMIENDGWMNNLFKPEAMLSFGKYFIILSLFLTIPAILSIIAGEFLQISVLIFIIFLALGIHTYFSTKKAMEGPIIYQSYYYSDTYRYCYIGA